MAPGRVGCHALLPSQGQASRGKAHTANHSPYPTDPAPSLYSQPMIHRWHAPHYQHVPLWLWPAVWWWLRRVDQWTELTGREVFVEVGPDGTVYSPWWDGMFETWDEETGQRLNTRWQPSDMNPHLPGRLATALNSLSCQGHTALSLVHAQPKGLSRNPPHLACAQRSARDQTPTSTPLQLGLPPPGLSSRNPRTRISGTQPNPANMHWVPALR